MDTVIVETPQGQMEIEVSISQQAGEIVVAIDTPGWEDGPDGPRFRLWINDRLVHEGVKLWYPPPHGEEPRGGK